MVPAPVRTQGPAAPEDAELERMGALLKPLGSPSRLRLLRLLVRPHYLEEVAAALGLSHQAARKHLDQLVRIGAVERRSGARPSGPVTEYVLNPQALFLIYNEFEKLGSLQLAGSAETVVRTLAEVDGREPVGDRAAPCLIVMRGFGFGRRVALRSGKGQVCVLGRDPRCDLVLGHDPYASNRQAEVAFRGGRWRLTDLRSTNGTEHNWAPMPSGGEVELRHGDVVRLGRSVLLFWDAR